MKMVLLPNAEKESSPALKNESFQVTKLGNYKVSSNKESNFCDSASDCEITFYHIICTEQVVKEFIISTESTELQNSNCHQEEKNKILRKEQLLDERKAVSHSSTFIFLFF